MSHEITAEMAAGANRRIYINPHFNRNASRSMTTAEPSIHVNQKFLETWTARRPVIHMNPDFLLRNALDYHLSLPTVHQTPQEHLAMPTTTLTSAAQSPLEAATSTTAPSHRKIVSKSRMQIVREPLPRAPPLERNTFPKPFIALGKRKLVRRGLKTITSPPKCNIVPSSSVSGYYKKDNRMAENKPPARTHLYSSNSPVAGMTTNRWKVPLTISSASPLQTLRKRSFVARYALRRANEQICQTRRNRNAAIPTGPNRKLELLNINGVLYKSTRNKLHRKDATSPGVFPSASGVLKQAGNMATPALQSKSIRKNLFVRGTKFVIDASGFKLMRSSAPLPCFRQRQRIDIGGLTYVASSNAKNEFIRSSNHLALAHVHTAKQRSLQLLSRRYTKNNVPCPIFQRLGKCAAYERGRCSKRHDKQQVAICPRFLRGECQNSACLLSHNVCLSKMPVCKFFLSHICVRTDCPYLHKKLSDSAEVCKDFLRGYCPLAQACPKRHEFVCANVERNGVCNATNCTRCKRQKSKETAKSKQPRPPPQHVQKKSEQRKEKTVKAPRRYFENETTESTPIYEDTSSTESNDAADNDDEPKFNFRARARPKLGILPSYIPLS